MWRPSKSELNWRTSVCKREDGHDSSASVRQQQIFLCEQFAQIPYRLDGFILSGFVDEDQALRVQFGLARMPISTSLGDVRPILFGGAL